MPDAAPPLDSAPAVRVDAVAHRYGDHAALRGISFAIAPGQLFGLLGPNGGGKTTLFRILSTLLPPTQGRAAVFGFDTRAQAAEVRRRLGVVFQTPALDAHLSVRENLRFHGALYGMGGSSLDARIGGLLGLFDLADRAGDRVGTLSGGLTRRADLARGLLHRPPLLLLDEPTTGLDPAARHAFWNALRRLREAEGTTLLTATHLLDEADACDTIAILDRGETVAQGAPEALKDALGAETLWITSDDLAGLSDRIEAQFGVTARAAGGSLQVAHPDAAALLPALYDAFRDRIASATIRKPTLEDVFLHHTGHRLSTTAGSVVA